MRLLTLPLSFLAFLGRHGTLAIAISLLVGAALPFLAATLRTVLDEAVFCMLILAFLRTGFRALGDEFKAPKALIISVIIALFLLPALALWLGQVTGLAIHYPDFYVALFIALAVPPVTATPIFASLLRLPRPIALAFLILAMIATPFAATMHARLFFTPESLPFDGLTIGMRLAGFLVGAGIIAAVIQRVVGLPRLEKYSDYTDGLNVLIMLVFAIAVMDGFGPALISSPGLVALIFAGTFALALGQMALMRGALWFMPADRASAIAMATGLRNMGLMVAALGMNIPQTTWLWFAIGQFPIYFMPWFVELTRKVRNRGSTS